MKLTKQAFTLVELIVVITILAILGTIAFISLSGYSAQSRDSVRISDVSSMKTALELFHLDAGKYPIPDNAELITYGTDLLWTQGTLGTTTVSQLSRSLNKIPKDPLSDKEYIFSVSWNRNDFQILNLLEGDLAFNPLAPLSGGIAAISQTNAADSTRTPRVDGKYNGLFVKTSNYIVPIPSLITSEPIIKGAGLTLNATNIKSQVTTSGKNIPIIGNIKSATGELNINLSVYSGPTITSTSPDSDKIAVMKAIQGAYTGSELASSDVYKLILNTADNELSKLAETIILDKTSAVNTAVDTEAPIGGDFTMPETTSTESITLTITCPTDVAGSTPIDMYISGTGLSSGGNIWENCVENKNITLTTGNGTKNVTMKFRDSLGNESEIVSKSLELNNGIPSCLTSTIRTNHTQSILDLPVGTWACMISNDGWVYALKLKYQIPRTTGITNVIGGDSRNYIDKVYTKNPSGVWRETTILDDDHTTRPNINSWNFYTDSDWYGNGAYWLFSDANCTSNISSLVYSYQIWSGLNCSDGVTTLFWANSAKHYINELRY